MLFNTMAFIIFFIVVLTIYWVIPLRFKRVWLLVTSYYFYMQWNPLYIALLFLSTIVTYIGGRKLMDKTSDEAGRKRKLIVIVCIVICLGVLGIFKYANFGIQTANRILSILNQDTISWTSKLILPAGISFYTLQAVGYIIDVYRGDIYAEKNFLTFALFLSFFPQLVAGPIERSKNLLKQLGNYKKFSLYNLKKGGVLILWGMFVKVVIADRAAIIVDTIYGDYITYNGFFILVATVLFSIQIYCDFYGYSTIARGAAMTMGISLTDNFDAPYFSKSIKEFWRRWHISLSSWFRDYLYIPLGGNRKGKARKNINLLIVFGISGLWHGATVGFLFWGLLNGAYQVISDLFVPIKKRLKKYCVGNILRTVFTFSMVSFAWIFFRAEGMKEGIDIVKNMISVQNWNIFFDGSIYNIGVEREYFGILCISILILLAVDYKKYQGYDMVDRILSQGLGVRYCVEMALLVAILVFGCYGELYDAASFIYFQF